jgi:multidrug efflux pump subunit AcrA (membrane-fusion protein)
MVDPETRTARVTVAIPNPDGRIWPGMYARVSLQARHFPDRILVPRKAVLERDRRAMVFVYEPSTTRTTPAVQRNQTTGVPQNGLAKWRYVTLGLGTDSLVEIVAHPETDAVRPGEVVLTDGHYTLIHDAAVRLVNELKQRSTPR